MKSEPNLGRALLGLLTLLVSVLSVPADFFVSPGGSDDSPGSEQKPFATLERARDALRQQRQTGGLPPGGTTIWLRAGDFPRKASLELTASDSGTAEAPVVWQAFRDEKVRLVGGRVLAGFQPVTNSAVINRLDEKARRGVRQADLRALGINEFGEMKRRGFGLSAPAHCELFYNGQPMTVARWPNEGEWARIAGFPEASAQGDDHGGKIGRLADGFTVDSDRPFGWKDPQDLWVHGYWAWDWANSYERVASLERGQRLVKTVVPYGHYGFRKGQRIFFLNVLEELDQPGEWFLDRATGVLYFWPPPGSGEDFTATLSILDQPLLRLKDASHITFQGMILEATRVHAVTIQGGASNRISSCIIRNVGNGGVMINGGIGHGVVDCDILDTGDGGVALSGGDRQTLTSGFHFVENCHFQRQGRWSKCYVPAISLNGVGMRASHNLIHDHPHAAILYGGNDHLIEFNEIHHVALETGDVGAIYMGRDYTMRGNRIRHNYLHHTSGPTLDARGVYMDDCASGTEVFGNVFYKAHWAMFIGGGRDHRVENNLFVDCDPAIVIDGRGLDSKPVWRNMVNVTMRKGVKAVPIDLYRERYPEMKTLDAYYGPPSGPAITGDAFRGVPPEGNVILRNVCAGDWLKLIWHAEEKLFDIRDNFVTTDRTQIGSPQTGFKLPPDSPAWKKGFQPIPFERIGLQVREGQKRLESIR